MTDVAHAQGTRTRPLPGHPQPDSEGWPAPDDLQEPATLELSCRARSAGELIVDFGGELDIVSAEAAVSYVRDVIGHHLGPVAVDLAALAFCDARGLGALLRMARYAEQAGCPFRVISPRPPLVKIMRITGLDRRFLNSQTPAQPTLY